MTQTPTATSPDAAPRAFFGVQRVFLKGISLELPQGAHVFLETAPPNIELSVQVEQKELAQNIYEVCLRATLSARAGDKTRYLLEVEQAGVFEVRDMTAQQMSDVLEIGAPNILSPYLRAQLSEALTRATLPVFYMPEMNWAAIAMERRAQAAGVSASAASTQLH